MSNTLIKRIELCKISLKDGQCFFIPLDKMEKFIATLESSTMVKLDGAYYSKWLVEKVSPEVEDERMLHLTQEQKQQLDSYTKYYSKGLGKPPSEYTKNVWITKIKNGERVYFNF